MALRAGDDLVGSRLAEMGQDLLLGGAALSTVGEEEESMLWKKGTLHRTGE